MQEASQVDGDLAVVGELLQAEEGVLGVLRVAAEAHR